MDDHDQYETRYGIPTFLARFEDTVFERLMEPDYKDWPRQFIYAMPVGVDLLPILPRIVIELVTRNEKIRKAFLYRTSDKKEEALATYIKLFRLFASTEDSEKTDEAVHAFKRDYPGIPERIKDGLTQWTTAAMAYYSAIYLTDLADVRSHTRGIWMRDAYLKCVKRIKSRDVAHDTRVASAVSATSASRAYFMLIPPKMRPCTPKKFDAMLARVQ
jgi:hypothetical protein